MAEWLSSLRLRLRALVRRRQLERDLQDEVAFHLAMREEQLRITGASDAATVARRRFGSVSRIREELHDAWAVTPTMGGLLRDLRYAARTLRRTPAFTAVIILTLGLGIGANTAFFTVVNAVLIRPLPYPEADRLVALYEDFSGAQIETLPFSPLDFDDLRAYQQSFESVAAYRNTPFELSGDGAPESITAAKVSADLFRTLRVDPFVGRAFLSAEDRPGTNVAILSWGLWQRRYAGDPAIVGRTIKLDRQPYTVVGVMPARFVFPSRGPRFNGEPAELWVPIAFTNRERVERGSMHQNNVIGRLKRGVSIEAARAELEVLSERITANYPATIRSAGFSPHLRGLPLREAVSGRLQMPVLLLMGAVGLLLLVACANVANLVLSRVAGRAREFAVRTALGAGRGQLIQLLLCEALLLSAAGGVLGLAVAYGAVSAAPAVLTRAIPGLHDVVIDLRVLAFTAAMCLTATLIFTVAPVPALGRRNPADSLRDDPFRATAGATKLRVQRGFVILTVTLACVLLVGAGLFMRSFAALLATDIGFRPAQVLIASMTLPRTFYTTAQEVRTFYDSLYGSLAAVPGVRSATLATDFPLTNYEILVFTPQGATPANRAHKSTYLTWVRGPYFETLGMTLRAGRFFTADEHDQNRGVVVVNQRLASLAWPGQDAIGKRLKWGTAESSAPWLTVVGVVRDVADGPIAAERGVHAYVPFRQFPDFFLNGAVNQFGRDLKAAVLAEGDPRALVPLVRASIARLDPDLAVQNIQPLTDQVDEVLAPQRLSTTLAGVFAAMAMLLASVGLYGLLAFTMAQRRQEIAVRIALGADRHAVVAMVIGHGVRLVAIGLALGLAGSLALSRVMVSLLYQTAPHDLVTFATVPIVVALAALVAVALPAWRAARVAPIEALRAE